MPPPPSTPESPGPLTLTFSGDYATLENVELRGAHGVIEPLPSGMFTALEALTDGLQSVVIENGPFCGTLMRSDIGLTNDWRGLWRGTLSYRRRVFEISESREGILSLSAAEWNLVPGPLKVAWTCGGDDGALDEIESLDPNIALPSVDCELKALLTTLVFERVRPEVFGEGGFGTVLLFPHRESSKHGQEREPIAELLAYLGTNKDDPEQAKRARELLEGESKEDRAHGVAFYEDVQEEEVVHGEAEVHPLEVTLAPV